MKCSLPLQIGTKIAINNYNSFLHNHESSGYKFLFQLNSDNKTGNVFIIGQYVDILLLDFKNFLKFLMVVLLTILP